jgi:nucleotide-binding universal stress UspA family protein
MFETIVVPLDGSELAEEVLGQAAALAKGLNSTLVLVQAIDSLAQRMSQPPTLLESPGVSAMNVDILQQALDAEKEAADKYLGAKRDSLTSDGVKAEAYVGEGPAVDVIMKLAADKGAAMIAMSTHGRGGLGRLVFGSVADAILKNSSVPVLLIRSAHHEKS